LPGTADNWEPADPAGRLRLRVIEAVSLAIVFGLVQWSVLQLLFGVSPEMAARTSEAGATLGRHRRGGRRPHRLAGADDAPHAQVLGEGTDADGVCCTLRPGTDESNVWPSDRPEWPERRRRSQLLAFGRKRPCWA
jgi:hypothetical protein